MSTNSSSGRVPGQCRGSAERSSGASNPVSRSSFSYREAQLLARAQRDARDLERAGAMPSSPDPRALNESFTLAADILSGSSANTLADRYMAAVSLGLARRQWESEAGMSDDALRERARSSSDAPQHSMPSVESTNASKPSSGASRAARKRLAALSGPPATWEERAERPPLRAQEGRMSRRLLAQAIGRV